MDILRLLGTAIAWVSGAVAGITAVLYAVGFFATYAHQRMLGVNWGVVSREPLWYLASGGQVLYAWLVQAMVVFFIVVLAGETILRLLDWLKRRDGRLTRYLGGLARWVDRNIVWFIAVLAMVSTGFLLEALAEPMSVRNLLLSEPGATCAAEGVTAAVIGNNIDTLMEHVRDVGWFSALAVGIGAYAVPRLASGEGPALPLLICVAVAINAAIAVPLAHGILQVDTRWQSVNGDGDGDVISTFPEGALRLLARTPDGLWAWDPRGPAVHLFVAGSYDHLHIGPTISIREALGCADETGTETESRQGGDE